MSGEGRPASVAEDFDETRELCADGNCLGVIVDGTCNVCGLSAGAEPALATETAVRALDDDLGAPFDEERQLCPDGACTGLLGSDGRCKECGRSAGS